MDLNKFNGLIDNIADLSKNNAELQGESFNSYHRKNFISYMHQGIDLFAEDIKSYFKQNKQALSMSKEEVAKLLDESSKSLEKFEKELFAVIERVEKSKDRLCNM